MGNVTWPFLSLYVDGCEQKLHNDSTNGRFGFVYSLTWDERKTMGGETIVLQAKATCSATNMGQQPRPATGLLDLIEPRFNRLAMFDDRMPHGVQRVEGSMDPLEGRFVLHGHISESGPDRRTGRSTLAAVTEASDGSARRPLLSDVQAMPVLHHGPLVLRITIEPVGTRFRRIDRLRRPARPRRRQQRRSRRRPGRSSLGPSAMRFPEAPAGDRGSPCRCSFGGNLPFIAAERAKQPPPRAAGASRFAVEQRSRASSRSSLRFQPGQCRRQAERMSSRPSGALRELAVRFAQHRPRRLAARNGEALVDLAELRAGGGEQQPPRLSRLGGGELDRLVRPGRGGRRG